MERRAEHRHPARREPHALAQTVATPLHVFQWDMTETPAIASGYSYEVQIDSTAYAPVLGVSCTGATSALCRGDLPQSLTPGAHTATLRAVKVVSGQRLVGPASNTLSFTYVGLPSAPTNLRLEISGTLTIKIGGQ